jgi:hypothetical protein
LHISFICFTFVLLIQTKQKKRIMNANTIKAAVRKSFPTVKILSVDKKSFGVFVVRVEEQRAKSVRKGFIMGNTDHDISANGVVLDKNINW